MMIQRHLICSLSFLWLLVTIVCSTRGVTANEKGVIDNDDHVDENWWFHDNIDNDRSIYYNNNNNIPEECQNETSSSPLHRYNSLTCWFYFLRVEIPEQSFRSHMISVHIKDLVCTNFTLQVVDSHYQPPAEDTDGALALGLANLSATCHGTYHSTGLSGSILAVLATDPPDNSNHNNDDDPTFHDPIRLLWSLMGDYNNSMEVYQPSEITTTSCISKMKIPTLRFSGSMSAHMIDWFRHSIQDYVQEKVSQEFCPALRDMLDPVVNHYLDSITGFLNQHLKWPFVMENDGDDEMAMERKNDNQWSPRQSLNGQIEANDESHGQSVRWYTEAPLLSNSMLLFNRFVNSHLTEGFLPRWLPSLDHREGKTCGFFFHGINGIIHALLDLQTDSPSDDDAVWYSVPLPPRVHDISFVWPGYAAISLDLYEIAIRGLDQWDHLELFQPQAVDDLFFSRIKTLKPIAMKMQAQLNVTSIPGGMFSGDHDLNEDFTVTFEFAGMDWNSTLALWVDRDLWQHNVTMGVLLDVIKNLWPGESGQIPKEALQCLLGSIQSFEAPDLSLNTTLSSMQVFPTISSPLPTLLSQSLEQDLDDLFNNALQLLIEGFPEYISTAIAGLVDGPLRDSLEGFLERITNSSQSDDDDGGDDNDYNNRTRSDGPLCPVPNEASEPHLLNFSEVIPIETLQEFMEHPKTIHRMNDYIQCTADYISGAVKGDSWDLLSLLGIDGDDFGETGGEDSSFNETSFKLRLDEFSFLNIGQIDSLTLMHPEDEGLSLSNSLVYGSGNSSNWIDGPHVTVQLSLLLPNIIAKANVSVFWSDLELASTSILHYDVNQLKSFGLADVFEHGHCLLTPIDDFETLLANKNDQHLLGLFAAIVNTSVVVDDDDQEQELSYSLSTLDYPTIQNLTEAIVTWLATSVRDIVNLGSIYSLSQASKRCVAGSSGEEHSDNDSDDYDSEGTWSLLLILASVFVLAQPAVLLLRSSNGEEEEIAEETQPRRQQDSADYTSHLTRPLLDPGSEHGQLGAESDGRESGAESDTKEPALVDCPHLPIFVRIFLPMLIMVTFAILVSSNVSVGASVELTAMVGQRTFHLPSLFEFSLVNTAIEMWNAGIYPVFFLVVVFSGIWPYAKLLIMLFCVASNGIHDARRGQVLLTLDSLGKFSLVDTYVLVLMMVAFRYDLKFFNSEAVSLDVLVEPQYGFYGFLLATTTSMIAGHMAVFYHRCAETFFPSGSTSELKCPPVSLLGGHSYQIMNERRKLSRFAQQAILGLWLSASVLLGVGMTRKSFVFEFGGLAGLALGDARRTEYSLISLGTAILQASSGTVGPAILMVTYFFYAVVAPFSCLLCLVLLLLVPMNVKRQLILLSMAEIANAWSAVEVFCLSIVAALLEISSFASFIMGDRCDTVNEVIQHYWPDGQDLADANCYTVRSSVKWDAAILILGAIINSFVVSIALRLIHTAVNDRVQQEGWVSLGSGNAFSGAFAQPESGWSFPERFLGVSKLFSWLFQNSDSSSPAIEPISPPTPLAPANSFNSLCGSRDESNIALGENGTDSPWRQGNGFVKEWENDAERDPSWKLWRDQENNGSNPDIPEDAEPLIETPGQAQSGNN